jgi:hypothetical protein
MPGIVYSGNTFSRGCVAGKKIDYMTIAAEVILYQGLNEQWRIVTVSIEHVTLGLKFIKGNKQEFFMLLSSPCVQLFS